MKIFSWNVNGIRSVIKKGDFDNFLKKFDPDIICLQETKAQKDQVEIDLPEYTEYWNSAEKKGYSGTAIFSKTPPLSVTNGIDKKIIEKYSPMKDTYGDPNTEGRVITAEYEKFYLVTVYTPNSKDDLSRIPLRHDKWDKAFLEHCMKLEKTGSVNSPQGKPVIFCGDLNVAHTEIDLARPKENEGKHGFTREERKGIDNIIKAGFVDTFRIFNTEGDNYTWWTAWGNARERNVGWRIDYFFASNKIQNKIKSAKIHSDQFGSDHCPVSIEIDIK
jgi:exodeoxyribonuclease III